ncbi:nitrate- and nitrite sensing domain-containing protein [Amycolatopsis sp. 195334CR]|uniref:sensor histidine kinase n=1 Tax=Amycolatopsis sp. 195334CR TaxID=2814588 RepID=UPI001F5E27A9|nr:nitrate- and nitrite sensing domain-containing protein [Amycolatopsis sp. 195334CR]
MTGDPGGRWRLRNWRLRTKLFAVLLIPSVAIIALVGLRVRLDLGEAGRLAEAATRVRVDTTVAELTHRLQRERDLTVRFVATGRKTGIEELRGQRDKVNESLGAFERALSDDESRLAPEVAADFRQLRDQLGGLTGLRYAGEFSNFPPDSVLRSYSDLITATLTVGDQSAAEITDPELARLRLAVNALAKVKDTMSVKRAVLADALAQGSLSVDRTRALLGAEAEFDAAREDFRQFATPEQRRMYDDTVLGMVVDNGNNMVESVLRRSEANQPLTGLDPIQWDIASTYTINLVRQVEDALQQNSQSRTEALAATARASAIRDSAIVLGVVLIGGVLAVIVTRSLLRSLRILRRSALEVAEHQLPAAVEGILTDPEPPHPGTPSAPRIAPVPVFSKEELGQVARAFDAVHGEAVRLAGEQARLRENVNSMFVNLSRRSQELVERQLSVLDRMEADEQDPEILGGLFELDHLATRMRRNSENLLVLSGTDPAREVAGPVSADEIVGAALSEVEHYQRIELPAAPELTVRAEAVSDLVHVISELLENATAYSPPATMVSVVSTLLDDGAWKIDIVDRGSGMAEAEVRRTNARLAEPPKVDVEVSRRMGLYVVARLSTRHRISVRLANRRSGGMTATVVVPPELVSAAAPVSLLPPEPVAALPVLNGPAAEVVVAPPERQPDPDPYQPEPSYEPESEPEPYQPDAEPRQSESYQSEPFYEPEPEPEPFSEYEPEPEWPAEPVAEEAHEAYPAHAVAEPRDAYEVAEAHDAYEPDWPEYDPEPPEPRRPVEPPTRAPVYQAPPDWPTEDDAHLDDEAGIDGPTERMPAYAEVLTRWFRDDEGAADERTAKHARASAEQAVLTLSPDAVRGRMASLQNGFERGRYVRDRQREKGYE